MKPVKTISDIAKLAKVSKSTVSRALNDNPVISRKTRKRIQTIATKYQFETHQGARCLSTNSSKTIALIYPESEHQKHMVTDPFFVEVLKGITSAVSEHGYDLLIGQPRKQASTSIRRYLESRRADGVIYLGCCHDSELDDDFEKNAALIICGSTSRSNNVCSVDCDNLSGGKLAAEHLLQCESRQIAFLGGPQGNDETELRFQGFSQTLQGAGFPLQSSLIVFGDYLTATGYRLTKQLLDHCPSIDGIFACSDLMAVGAMEAARENGREPGKDISVVGFDDIPFAQFGNPPLTTIRQNILRTGEVLVNKLMAYMNDGVVSKSILPVTLVIRKSTRLTG